MFTETTPEQAKLLQQRPDIKARLYVDEAGRWHVVHYFERVDEGQHGYTRRAVVMWNPAALGRGVVVISPEVFYASTEAMPETVGEGLP